MNFQEEYRRVSERAIMDDMPTPEATDIYKMFDAAEGEAWRFIARAYLDRNCEGK